MVGRREMDGWKERRERTERDEGGMEGGKEYGRRRNTQRNFYNTHVDVVKSAARYLGDESVITVNKQQQQHSEDD